MKTIGFIGTGVMGKSMAHHLIEAGYEVHIYNRTKSKAEDLINQGAYWHDDVKSVSAVSDCVMTMVGYPSDVEAIYFGEDGIIEHAKKGSLLIDFTTSRPNERIRYLILTSQKNKLRAQPCRELVFYLSASVTNRLFLLFLLQLFIIMIHDKS